MHSSAIISTKNANSPARVEQAKKTVRLEQSKQATNLKSFRWDFFSKVDPIWLDPNYSSKNDNKLCQILENTLFAEINAPGT